MGKKAAASLTWTGKNLAEMKSALGKVKHYPEGKTPHFRDWSQHPDNLHVETDEGHTVIVEVGDKVVRDADGHLTVEKGGKAPRALRAVPPATGRVYHVTAGGSQKASEEADAD